MQTSRIAGLACAALLAACNGFGDGDLKSAGVQGVPNTETRAGTQRHVILSSKVDGADISFEVYEPDQLVAGETYPLVLHGHGYGGSRQTTRDGFIARLTAAGYYVISVDERGFGNSGGQVRSMSPDYEGQDLVLMLDWAEELPGLRRRDDGTMLVGAYGGSYGGMYQLLLLGADPHQRLRVLAPDITPHDLTYSLAPHNVVKSGWGLVLAAGGEADNVTNLPSGQLPTITNQDPAIVETLIQATLFNAFAEAGMNFFRYHSVRYFCDGQPAGPQPFVYATPDPLAVPPRPFARADVLFTQGMRDTLFNLNEAYANYACLARGGGDVRLLTHESGHILPVNPPAALETALDQFYAALTLQAFQDAGGSRSCGSMPLDDVQFAWFEEKLQNRGTVDAVLKSGHDVCMTLAEGDAIAVREVKSGGDAYEIDSSIPQFSSVLGIGGHTLGNGAREALLATQPMFTAPAGGAVLAGIPTATLSVEGLSGAEPGGTCTVPLAIGACDPILFLAIGHRHAGMERWDIVDDQITPVRGFGEHTLDMNGVAERLAEGDELALLIYGFHFQFPVTWSRDVVVPAVNLGGTVSLPLLTPGEISAQGI